MIKRLLSVFVALACVFLSSSGSYAAQPREDPPSGSVNIYLPLVRRSLAQDWIGPDGGLIAAIVIDPQNLTTMYAGSWGGGVYKSIDGGTSWRRAAQGLENLIVVSLAIDPANPATLYAGTYRGGVYKSSDHAGTWSPANTGIQDQAIVYSIVIDPQYPQRVFAATRGISNNDNRPWAGIVYRSVDGGANWSPSLYDLGGPGYQDWTYSLEINPNDPKTIFAATHEHGPVRSTDYGETWKVLTNGISNKSTRAIVVNPRPQEADTVYTGVWTKDGVFKSNDGGGNWELKSEGLTGANIYGMAIDPFAPKTIYAATYNMGVMKTTNGANAWAGTGISHVGIATLRVSPADGQTVFAGTAGDGLYLSNDGGQTWKHSQTHLSAVSVTSLVVTPDASSNYYASLNGGGGIMRSQDRGRTWSLFNNHLSDPVIHQLVKHPVSNTLFALSDGSGLYRCNLDDSTTCWQKVGLDLPEVSFSRAAPNEAQWADLWESFLRLYEDLPAGNTKLASSRPAPLLTMVFAPSDPNRAYLGTSGAGIYTSTDGGNSWSSTSLNTQRVWSLAVHPSYPNILAAATDPPGAVRTSFDSGNTWQEINIPGENVSTLAISPAQPNILLAGTSSGVYRFSEGVWTQIGLAGLSVTALGIHPTRPELYAAATPYGVWISPNSGDTWLPSPIDLQSASIQSISFSPQNPELVFYNTRSNGILRAEIGY